MFNIKWIDIFVWKNEYDFRAWMNLLITVRLEKLERKNKKNILLLFEVPILTVTTYEIKKERAKS